MSPETRRFTPERLTTEEAAHLTGLPAAWFVSWRRHGGGPPVVKEGKQFRYPSDGLRAWIAQRVKMSRAPKLMYRQWLKDQGLTEAQP